MAKEKTGVLQTAIAVTDAFSEPFILFEKRIHHALVPLKKLEYKFERLKRVTKFDLFKEGWSDFRKNSKDFILNIRNIGQSFSYVKAAASSVVDVLDKVSSRGDELAKTSRRLGIPIDSLQKLRYAADLAGVPMDMMQESVRKMAVGAVRAAHGVEKEKRAFKALGVTVKDANGEFKSSEQLLLEISNRFKSANYSAVEKLYAANEIFGNSGAKMIEMLNQGPEVLRKQFKELEDIGLMTQKDTDASEKYNDTLAKMRKSVERLEEAVASDLFAPMTEAVEYLTGFMKENKDVFTKALEPFIKSIPTIVEHLTKALPGLLDAFVWLAKRVDDFVRFFGLKFPIISIIVASVITPFVLSLAGLAKMIYVVVRAVVALVAKFIPVKKAVDQVAQTTSVATQKASFFKRALDKVKAAGSSTLGVFKKLPGVLQKVKTSFNSVGKSAMSAGRAVGSSGNSAMSSINKMIGSYVALNALAEGFESLTDKKKREQGVSRIVVDMFESIPILGSLLKGVENMSVGEVEFDKSDGGIDLSSMDFENSELFKMAKPKTINNTNTSRIDVNFNNVPKNTEIKRYGFNDPSMYGFSMSPAF